MANYWVPVLTCQLVRDGRVRVDHRVIRCPTDAAAMFREHLSTADREHFVCLFLNSRNSVGGIHTVSIGTLTEAVVHPREVFKAAILASSVAIIVGHNHPSGDPSPSPEDIAVSQRLAEAGKLLGIPVLDSLIIADNRHVSLKERGILE